MKYAVIHRPDINTDNIERISKKYDPTYGLVGPHVTLVFPFSTEDVEEAGLVEELRAVANETEPFKVCFADTELSWDQWLFLTPTTGRDDFTSLHDRLYELPELRLYLRKDILFVPHIVLGQFVLAGNDYDLANPTQLPLDQERYAEAQRLVSKTPLEYEYVASRIELISITDDFKTSQSATTFELGK